MPSIYLSPSLQEYNQYTGGGTEEEYMNLIANAMEPYLTASGIQFTRNRPDMTLGQAIRQSNAGNYDLHLALHSNAAPPNLAGRLQGTDVYYYAASAAGRRAADIIAQNFKNIYPDPGLVKAVGTTSLAELRQTRAPAVLVEIAYHDNERDAQWIRDNIDAIARNLAQSLTQYFGIPFVSSQSAWEGTVRTQSGGLNLRSMPGMDGEVIGLIPNGARVRILGQTGEWFEVNYNGTEGYASSRYIQAG